MARTLLRTVRAAPERVWQLWTTASGIERWWALDGFTTTVQQIDVVLGGQLRYTMTASAPDKVAYMQRHGIPLATHARKTFTDVHKPDRLAYSSWIDFVPGHEPYEQLTVVDLTPVDNGTRVQMTMESLHDDVWTERLAAGRRHELDNLARLIDPQDDGARSGTLADQRPR